MPLCVIPSRSYLDFAPIVRNTHRLQRIGRRQAGFPSQRCSADGGNQEQTRSYRYRYDEQRIGFREWRDRYVEWSGAQSFGDRSFGRCGGGCAGCDLGEEPDHFRREDARSSEKLGDVSLETEVAVSLAAQTGVNALGVKAHARDGVVTLQGHVPSEAVKSVMWSAAKKTHGVKRIVDEIEVGE